MHAQPTTHRSLVRVALSATLFAMGRGRARRTDHHDRRRLVRPAGRGVLRRESERRRQRRKRRPHRPRRTRRSVRLLGGHGQPKARRRRRLPVPESQLLRQRAAQRRRRQARRRIDVRWRDRRNAGHHRVRHGPRPVVDAGRLAPDRVGRHGRRGATPGSAGPDRHRQRPRDGLRRRRRARRRCQRRRRPRHDEWLARRLHGPQRQRGRVDHRWRDRAAAHPQR